MLEYYEDLKRQGVTCLDDLKTLSVGELDELCPVFQIGFFQVPPEPPHFQSFQVL